MHFFPLQTEALAAGTGRPQSSLEKLSCEYGEASGQVQK